MALSGFEPSPLDEPRTESVSGGRRAAVAVAVVAVLVVGALIWKPWDSGAGAPGSPRPSGSPPALAAATTAPTPTATSEPTPTPPPSTTEPENQEEVAPGDLGSVMLASGQGAYVYCVYGGPSGAQPTLISMLVTEPIVVTTGKTGRDLVKRVNYRPEIESNSLEGIFSTEWSYVTAGPTQRRAIDSPRGLRFDTVQINVESGDLPASGVVRVAVVINWIGKDGKRLATQRLYPKSYAPLGDGHVDPVPEGCPART